MIILNTARHLTITYHQRAKQTLKNLMIPLLQFLFMITAEFCTGPEKTYKCSINCIVGLQSGMFWRLPISCRLWHPFIDNNNGVNVVYDMPTPLQMTVTEGYLKRCSITSFYVVHQIKNWQLHCETWSPPCGSNSILTH